MTAKLLLRCFSSPCSFSPRPVASHLVLRRRTSSGPAPPRNRAKFLPAVIHDLAAAGRYTQAIRSTKCLIQQQQQQQRRRRAPIPCSNLGQQVYAALQKIQPSFPAAFDVLLVALCGSGLLEEALWVYRQLGDPPSVNAYNAVLAAVLRAGRLDCLRQLHAGMLARGRQPSAITQNILLDACRREGDHSRALRLLLDDVASPSVVSFTTVICGLCEEGRMKDALSLFYRMLDSGVAPNLYTFNVLLDGHLRAGHPREALALFAAILRRGLRPNVVTFGILARNEEPERLLRYMVHDHGVRPNGHVYNALMHGLCESGRLPEALKLMGEMAAAGVRPDVFTCGVLAKALCNEGRPRAAEEMMRGCFREEAQVALVLYNILIHGYCRKGEMAEAERVWEEMAQRGVEPDEITFSVMIDAHGRRGDMEAARGAVREMAARGRAPDVVTHTSLMDAYLKRGELGQAREVWREMGFRGNAFTACAVIDGLCRMGKSREAVSVWLERADAGIVDRVACMALIRGLHADAQDFKAGRVFLRMREAGFVPDAATYGVLLEGQRRLGRPMNTMALLADILKAGVTAYREECYVSRADSVRKSKDQGPMSF